MSTINHGAVRTTQTRKGQWKGEYGLGVCFCSCFRCARRRSVQAQKEVGHFLGASRCMGIIVSQDRTKHTSLHLTEAHTQAYMTRIFCASAMPWLGS